MRGFRQYPAQGCEPSRLIRALVAGRISGRVVSSEFFGASSVQYITASLQCSSSSTAAMRIGAGLAAAVSSRSTIAASFLSELQAAPVVTASVTADLTTQPQLVLAAQARSTLSLYSTPPAALTFIGDSGVVGDESFDDPSWNYTFGPPPRHSKDVYTIPVGCQSGQVGDLILVWFISNAFTLTPPNSNWVQLIRQPLSGVSNGGNPNFRLYCFYWKDDGTYSLKDNTRVHNFTWDGTGNTGMFNDAVENAQTAWSVSRWRNPRWATPIYPHDEPIEAVANLSYDAGVFNAAASPDTWSVTIPSLDATDANGVLVLAWADESIGPTSYPGGLTKIARGTAQGGAFEPDADIVSYYKVLSSTGATGTFTSVQTEDNPFVRSAAAAVLLRYQGAAKLFFGSANSRSTLSGTLLALPVALAATPACRSTITAAIRQEHALAAAPAGASSVAAVLTIQSLVAAAPQSRATVTAALTTATGFATATSASSAVAAALTTQVLAAASASARAVLRSELATLLGLKSAQACTCTLSAAATTSVRLQAFCACRCFFVGTLGPFSTAAPSSHVREKSTEVIARTTRTEVVLS